MTIAPTTDIIADVIRAAEPGRAASIKARLKSIASAPVDMPFSKVMTQEAARLSASVPASGPVRAPMRSAPTVADPELKSKNAMVEFEGTILGMLFSEVIPKDQSSISRAGGVGGDVWRSMLSNEIGRQLAKSGVLKLQERLFRTHPLGAGRDPLTAAAASINSLAAPQNAARDVMAAAPGASRARRN